MVPVFCHVTVVGVRGRMVMPKCGRAGEPPGAPLWEYPWLVRRTGRTGRAGEPPGDPLREYPWLVRRTGLAHHCVP